MAPRSPSPRSTPPHAYTISVPSPAVPSGSSCRTPPPAKHIALAGPARTKQLPVRTIPPPQPSLTPVRPRNERPPPTQAEAYASANQPRREREKERPVTGKPIFDWITRKLAGRRATFSVPDTRSRVNLQSGSPRAKVVALPPTPAAPTPQQASPLSPTQIFAPSTLPRDVSGSITRSESHSLRSYSYSHANSSERDRRRELNNPYPSMPVHFHRTSTVDTESRAPSTSFFTRSRTPSQVSLESSMRPRISMADDGSSQRYAGRWADEDASVRPIPPSHPGSPTPSNSFLSRSASASLLSPQAGQAPPPTRLTTRHSTTSSGIDHSIASSEQEPPADSRRNSSSTKPTTVQSFDSGPHVAHIAQPPPPAPLTLTVEDPSSTPSTPNITPVSSPLAATAMSPLFPTTAQVQAPKHSHPHPRDNPHPASPPDLNASTITLASSTFAIRPGSVVTTPASPVPIAVPTRLREPPSQSLTARASVLGTSPSVTWAPAVGDAAGPTVTSPDRPVSLYDAYPPSAALSLSFRTGGWSGAPGGGGGRADRDASVRAVRRKGSWESYESGWSWRAAGALGYGQTVGGGGEASLRNRTSMLVPGDEETTSAGVGLAPPIRDKDRDRESCGSNSLSQQSVRSASLPAPESPLVVDRYVSDGIVA